MSFRFTVSKAAISAIAIALSMFAGTKLNSAANTNSTSVICSPPVAAQAQPKG